MRDTLRDSTASLRSDETHNYCQTLTRFNLPVISPDLLTASLATCQEEGHSRILVGELAISKVGDAVDRLGGG
jgi:hypothetical protein